MIVDKHTGFVWLRKTGTKQIGTAEEVERVLDETMGPNIFSIKKFKTDRANNLTESVMKELCQRFGIWQDQSSAYNPSGNTHVESTVGRVKRVLGKRKVEDALREVNALNLSQPYSDRVQTPNEEMTGRPSQVSGIPAPDYILNSKIPAERITKGEYRGTDPTFLPPNPTQREKTASPVDQDPDTALENEMSKDWLEQVSDKTLKQALDCGDRVFYIDYNVGKGPRRWRTGIIIQRKKEFFYHASRRTAHGYDIYDVENCTHVTRSRKDIRKYRFTKMEREAMEQINKNLGVIRTEYYKNQKFISPGEFKVPPEFELKGYDDEPPTAPNPAVAPSADNQQQHALTPAPENPPEEPTADPPDHQPEAVETQEHPTQETEPEPAQPAPTKAPRMLSRLSNELDGSNWRNPNFTIGPLRSRRRFVTSKIEVWNYEGDLEGSPDNTEPVPDDEPQTDLEGPGTPTQAETSTQDAPEQKNP